LKNGENMTEDNTQLNTFEEESDDDLSVNFSDYKVSTSPNDFNIKTLVELIDNEQLIIPGFQRNFVWDQKRSSRLIESLLIGLPIPQIFLYEYNKKFLVIDGQQRLMSLYYFQKGRFPKKDKAGEIRNIYLDSNKIPKDLLADNNFYQDFKLMLPKGENKEKAKFAGLGYSSLGDLQFQFDMRTIRSITIQQNFPDNDDSCMFEIFNRLNTGGISLAAQEIRASMYYSSFYKLLYHLNSNENWRTVLNSDSHEIHMKDIEIMLRGIALAQDFQNKYKHPMVNFLNKFSKDMMKENKEILKVYENIFVKFVDHAGSGASPFIGKNNRFIISLFDSIFVSSTREAFKHRDPSLVRKFDVNRVKEILNDSEFSKLIAKDTTSKESFSARLKIVEKALFS
jgi:hypothetical protein